jgi:hypothetical protein
MRRTEPSDKNTTRRFLRPQFVANASSILGEQLALLLAGEAETLCRGYAEMLRASTRCHGFFDSPRLDLCDPLGDGHQRLAVHGLGDLGKTGGG